MTDATLGLISDAAAARDMYLLLYFTNFDGSTSGFIQQPRQNVQGELLKYVSSFIKDVALRKVRPWLMLRYVGFRTKTPILDFSTSGSRHSHELRKWIVEITVHFHNVRGDKKGTSVTHVTLYDEFRRQQNIYFSIAKFRFLDFRFEMHIYEVHKVNCWNKHSATWRMRHQLRKSRLWPTLHIALIFYYIYI